MNPYSYWCQPAGPAYHWMDTHDIPGHRDWQHSKKSRDTGACDHWVKVVMFSLASQESSLYPLCSFWNKKAGLCYLYGTWVKIKEKFALLAASPLYHARPDGKPTESKPRPTPPSTGHLCAVHRLYNNTCSSTWNGADSYSLGITALCPSLTGEVA